MDFKQETQTRNFKKECFDEKKSQTAMCLEYLERYGSITQLEALYAFNCMRLSAQIFKLRDMGYDIKTDIAKGKKGYGIYTLIS